MPGPIRMASILTCLICCFAAATMGNDSRPPAPEGFAWERLEEVKIDVLVPDGWIVTRFDEKKGTLAYKITSDKTFETGLTINVITNVAEKTVEASEAVGRTVDAPIMAAWKIEEYKDDAVKVLDEWEPDVPGFLVRGCEVLKPIDGVFSRIRATAVGNIRTDTMYVWMFGSPKSRWKEAWEYGEKMLNPILIDDEF